MSKGMFLKVFSKLIMHQYEYGVAGVLASIEIFQAHKPLHIYEFPIQKMY